MKSGAIISDCQKYRYLLWRIWGDLAPVMIFQMMNPSTADAEHDDATIRKCIKFALREHCSGIAVVNVFAFRTPHPKHLLTAEDPCGPENLKYIMNIRSLFGLSLLVAAWGNPVGGNRLVHRYNQATNIARGNKAKCLGVNKDGSPKHPLYLRDNTPLIDWTTP